MKPADKSPGGGGAGPKKASQGCCPVCGKPIAKGNRPFCSRRCANVDLNRWLSDAYVIKGPPSAGEGELEQGD